MTAYFVLFASVTPITKVSPCKGEGDVKVEVENDEEKIKNENLKNPVDEKVLALCCVMAVVLSRSRRLIHEMATLPLIPVQSVLLLTA